jgi:hypothetical protein
MIVRMERAQALMSRNLESKSLCDPLYREVAELLQFNSIHVLYSLELRGYSLELINS